MLTEILVYFFHAAAVVFTGLTLLWVASVMKKDASLIDIYWGFGFLLVAAVCLYLVPNPDNYQVLLAALPILWGFRLTAYLARRNLGHGEDKRYIAMQKRAAKKGMSETTWRLRSLLTIYFGQGLLIMIVSAPIWIAMTTGDTVEIGPVVILGVIIWLIGFIFETLGDWQLAQFLKRHSDYDGPIETKPVLDTGLWKYTRHPNYFGNACMWWGIWLAACAAPLGWVSIFAPVIMTLLLTKVSGRDLLERDMKKRATYRAYVKRTSGFFPMPPKSG